MVMASTLWISLVVLGAATSLSSSVPASAPAKEEVERVVATTNSGPATVGLRELFRKADVVALVAVVAGDAENYRYLVYKASVVQAFKGVSEDDAIYFGPYQTYAIGKEYIVFLKRTSRRLGELRANSRGPAGPFQSDATYLQIMYQGFGVMEVSYTCVIPSCDWGVEVADQHVMLPSQLATVPSECRNRVGSCAWVRRDDFLAELSRHKEGK
jgi:hypothetical protein